MDAKLSWADKFDEYERKNPDVYRMFKRFALEMITRGKKTSYGIIFGRIRYETSISDTEVPFKLSQNYAPYYARKFAAEFPQYADAFIFKKIKGIE